MISAEDGDGPYLLCILCGRPAEHIEPLPLAYERGPRPRLGGYDIDTGRRQHGKVDR